MLSELYQSGALSKEEFEELKKNFLSDIPKCQPKVSDVVNCFIFIVLFKDLNNPYLQTSKRSLLKNDNKKRKEKKRF